MYKEYNKENETKKIEFIKLDGSDHAELRRRYKVNGFPSVFYLAAGKRGKVAKEFTSGDRSAANMKTWLEE